MSDGMERELAYMSSHATNRYFIPNWGIILFEAAVSTSRIMLFDYSHKAFRIVA